MSDDINWTRLEELYQMCRRLAVSFELTHCEADDSFRVTIDSAAPAERWAGGDKPFDLAMDDALRELRRLQERT